MARKSNARPTALDEKTIDEMVLRQVNAGDPTPLAISIVLNFGNGNGPAPDSGQVRARVHGVDGHRVRRRVVNAASAWHRPRDRSRRSARRVRAPARGGGAEGRMR